jgi:c(7)-type cytochrome triheme protein
MRNLLACFLLVSMAGLTFMVSAQEKKTSAAATAKLVFQAKNGNVLFDHAAHAKRAKENCKTCHPALWPQDAKAPLNFKAAMHKTAVDKKTSCGFCHHPGGQAFTTTGNCAKCHSSAKKG